MGHRQQILAQIAEEVEDVFTTDDAEARAREAISDAITEYERLLCKDEIKELVAPFTEAYIEFDDDLGVVQATEDDFADLDAVFEEADQRYLAKEGKVYRFSPLKERPSVLASKIYNSQMDIAGRYVTAGEIKSLSYIMDPLAYDPMACPVCLSTNTTPVYSEENSINYMCNECGKTFAVDVDPRYEIEYPCDTIDFNNHISAEIILCEDGAYWSVAIDEIVMSEGCARGYAEALDHCKTWYDRYIGIDPGDVYASSHTGSKMKIEAKNGQKISGVRLDTGNSFTVNASIIVDQILNNDLIRSASRELYADTAEEGDQYQKEDGNIIEVLNCSDDLIQYADSESDANMFNDGATKWLPKQEFYSMIDKKGYVLL